MPKGINDYLYINKTHDPTEMGTDREQSDSRKYTRKDGRVRLVAHDYSFVVVPL